MISTHYAYIIGKGFEVTINGNPVVAEPIEIIASNKTEPNDGDIMPFVFRGEMDGVKVYLTVGLTGRLPTGDEITKEQETTTNSSRNAGWTVICNDRIVLYHDRTELTGMGRSRSSTVPYPIHRH